MRYQLPTIRDLDELTRLVEGPAPEGELFLRWSQGPDVDLPDGGSSRDTLTGIALPGLSANPPAVEAWVLAGEVCGRRPDNERVVDDLGADSWGPLDRVASRRTGEGPPA